jgi:hypothetical protein
MAIRVGFGFKAHTGWAAVVVLAEPSSAPTVVATRRVQLAKSTDLDETQVYHSASKLPAKGAAQLVDEATKQVRQQARSVVNQLIRELKSTGCEIVGAGLVLGNAHVPPQLETILRSHALIHAAEGDLFRQALAAAIQDCGLTMTGLTSKELFQAGAARLRTKEDALRLRITQIGKGTRPWTQDQKESAMVAWLAMSPAPIG